MRITLHLGGQVVAGDSALDLAAAHALLGALDAQASVQAAAARLGSSYRSAWGRLAALDAAFGRPVAVKTKGHGTVLTPFGAALLAALAETFGRVEPLLEAERARLEARLGAILGPGRLRLAVSHDALVLDALAGFPEVAVTTAGSTDALARLAAGLADAAGFHFGAGVPEAGSPFAALFADPAMRIRPAFRREQGLMVAPGNPLGLRTVADLAAPGLRFVNRQRGAGTRIWFERLCAEAGIDPQAVAGRATEEFTHQAVAALIASGAADAGMGARAVAERFGLGFLPVGTETYFLAMRACADPLRLDQILAALRMRAAAATGYAPPD